MSPWATSITSSSTAASRRCRSSPVAPWVAPTDAAISVIGGLSFFGGPGSNYLTHAVATMVERIRAGGGTGFVHGVGMFNTKHHAVVLADHPRDDGRYPRPVHDIGAARPPVEPPVAVVEAYAGPGTILTCTVMFDRDGTTGTRSGDRNRRPRGTVRGEGRPHDDTLDALTSGSEPVGRVGTVTTGDIPEFTL